MPKPEHCAGYADPWVTRAGDTVRFKLSARPEGRFKPRLVRVLCANEEIQGPPGKLVPVAAELPEFIDLTTQPLLPGSGYRGALTDTRPAGQFTLCLALFPGSQASNQRVVSLDGATLRFDVRLDGNHLKLGIDGQGIPLGLYVNLKKWVVLNLSIDLIEGRVQASLSDVLQTGSERRLVDQATVTRGFAPRDPCRLSGELVLGRCLDGRIDSPLIARGCRDLRQALFLDEPIEDLVIRPAFGELVALQSPITSVRGCRWDGTAFHPALKPSHYSAAHFNREALTDAAWSANLDLKLPDDLPSGAYALHLEGEHCEQWVSFFVSAAGKPKHRLAFLAPTYSYLAYSNAPAAMRGPMPITNRHVNDHLLDRVRPDYGRSLYERHFDGMGVHFASDRRPILNAAPGNRPWGLVADTLLLDWLHLLGIEADLITDHDLHQHGAEVLKPYSAVLTGNHPEYVSTRMWDGVAQYLESGGRLAYLGGNGFYARIAVTPDGRMIEARRAEDGTRPYIAESGEYVMALNGEYGGMWRRLGRAPQKLLGVGTAAQGFVRSAPYNRLPESDHPAFAWLFEEVPERCFGTSGVLGGGASGYEIDRYDTDVGTPASAVRLATATDHDPSMMRSKEELLSNSPPFIDRKVRSDMVLMPVGQRGGAVFSVGSMTWVGSLHSDEGVAHITRNVIERFLDPAPLVFPLG